MRVHVLASQTASSSEIIAQHHALRADVFGGRLGWDVTVEGGLEVDEYDRLDPTYLVASRDDGCVVGCVRLLPATGPTMLERTFPQLLARGSLCAHAAMVESSRFCVDTSTTGGRRLGLHLTTLTMFAAIIEWSMLSGYTEIVTATDLRFERILKRAGWPLQRLGEPCAIGNTIAVAGRLPADEESFNRVCPPEYASDFRNPATLNANVAA